MTTSLPNLKSYIFYYIMSHNVLGNIGSRTQGCPGPENIRIGRVPDFL